MFMIAAYIESRSRPSFRPRMYRRERGRERCRPAGRNPRRVFILEVRSSARPPRSRKGKAARTSSLARENEPSRYPHTAANEPRRHLGRLSPDGVVCGGMMLILKYFLVVGAVLTLGLIALNAHLLPDGSKAPAAVIHSATTASPPTVTPNVPPTDTNVVAEPSQPPPAKSASSARRSHHSARAQRRSH
jgi:hypothetical protein